MPCHASGQRSSRQKINKVMEIIGKHVCGLPIAENADCKIIFGSDALEISSAGVDFTAENIVKLEVYSFDSDPVVPVALTADGRLIFPDYLLEESESVEIGVPLDPLQPVSDGLSMCDVAHASMEFTDVEDFVLTCVNGVDGYIMIVKKTDGSLHVTKNNYYDTEYLIEQ